LDLLISLGLCVVVLYIAYLLIKTAVRNGIDESTKVAKLEKLLAEVRNELRKKETEQKQEQEQEQMNQRLKQYGS